VGAAVHGEPGGHRAGVRRDRPRDHRAIADEQAPDGVGLAVGVDDRVKIVRASVVQGVRPHRRLRCDEELVVEERSAKRCLEKVVRDGVVRVPILVEVGIDRKGAGVIDAHGQADCVAACHVPVLGSAVQLVLLLVELVHQVAGAAAGQPLTVGDAVRERERLQRLRARRRRRRARAWRAGENDRAPCVTRSRRPRCAATSGRRRRRAAPPRRGRRRRTGHGFAAGDLVRCARRGWRAGSGVC